MSSMVKMIGSRGPAVVMGEVEERTMTTIAADIDGVVQPEEIGKRHTLRYVRFAFRNEAEAWIAAQESEGWTLHAGPMPCACSYFGDTDSDSNCWSCEVEREVPRNSEGMKG